MEELKQKVKAVLQKNGRFAIILIIGIMAMLLIAFSDTKEEATASSSSAAISDEDYCLQLENKIKSLVSAITGDTDCIVGITLENGSEYIYADQNKLDNDQTENKNGEDITTKESHKSEQEYIIVEGKDGVQTPLIITEKKPGVRGVAIVTYGITTQTKEQIYAAVSSMLGIPERKINISQKVS